MDDYGITPMETFTGTEITINIKNQHKWDFPVYVLDVRFQVNIDTIIKWEPRSRAGIYLGH